MALQATPQAPVNFTPGQFVLYALKVSWWVWISVAALIAALATGSTAMLNYVHVVCAILWTGTDLFMGFVIGPILRGLAPEVRGAVVRRLMPRMLFYMPVIAAVTTTAGWYLAHWLNLYNSPAVHWWYVTALVLAGLMFVQGLGILLPINLRVFFEVQKERPDGALIGRLMVRYKNWVAFQAILQLGIVFVMVHFVFG